MRTLSRFALIGVIGGGAAACSSDASRLGDPFVNPFASNLSSEPSATGSLPENEAAPAPAIRTGRIQSEALGAPASAPLSPAAPRPALSRPAQPPAQSTRVAATGAAGWNAQGGTRITVAQGDSLNQMSTRYGVPASAILSANGLTSAAQVTPGRQIVIPVYTASGMNPDAMTARTVPAAPQERLQFSKGPKPADKATDAKAADVKAADVKAQAEKAQAEKLQADKDAKRRAEKLAEAKLEAKRETERKEAEARKLAEEKARKEAAQKEAAKKHVRPGQTAKVEPKAEVKAEMKPDPKAEAAAKAKIEAARDAARKLAEAKAAKEGAEKAAKEAKEAKEAEKAAKVAAAKPAPAPEKTEPSATGSVAAAAPDQSFRWPAKGRVIAGYGSSGNEGINIAVPEGTAVKAAEDGTVAYAGSDVKGYGKLVLVRHTNGYVSAYAHNGEIDVKPGEKVKRGQTIAKSGASGNVTSPQLHFEIRKGGSPIDPMSQLASN
ncbi:peptidoglycan DD-metalloendopeptidase family protein [Methylobacterium segetis]|uniref:peptidoglycan DD-metalloendopeptidase family protein n=1 Tax=Methylobacterium segetis TaxID=2488750 RepID=UPI003CCB1929